MEYLKIMDFAINTDYRLQNEANLVNMLIVYR